MTELWRNIPDFPRYDVSSLGRIRNVETGRDMALTINQRGITYVGLMKDGVQLKRSVAVLTARAYLDIPQHVMFDTVIHLDGDRQNCAAHNLMWRPHHFTINYMRQFREDPAWRMPVYCPETEELFYNSREMATRYGLLERDIVTAMVNEWMVWPTKLTVREVGP